jgi:hypothetical protein
MTGTVATTRERGAATRTAGLLLLVPAVIGMFVGYVVPSLRTITDSARDPGLPAQGPGAPAGAAETYVSTSSVRLVLDLGFSTLELGAAAAVSTILLIVLGILGIAVTALLVATGFRLEVGNRAEPGPSRVSVAARAAGAVVAAAGRSGPGRADVDLALPAAAGAADGSARSGC